jgi:predicted nucleic acid-binding protein
MIILDTNVLSEMMRVQPNQSVLNWLDVQESQNLCLTAITVAEILYGVARLTGGKRKKSLHDIAVAMFDEDFSGRIQVFDEYAAAYYAELVALREQQGFPISMADAQIAAICKNNRATLATRNIKDFIGLELDLINPWELF